MIERERKQESARTLKRSRGRLHGESTQALWSKHSNKQGQELWPTQKPRLLCGVLGGQSRGTNKGLAGSEDRQTRSDCHSARWSRNRGRVGARVLQGTVLKRLAVTKRMKAWMAFRAKCWER